MAYNKSIAYNKSLANDRSLVYKGVGSPAYEEAGDLV